MRMFVDVPFVYLHRPFVDFRKSINGLTALVETELVLPLYRQESMFKQYGIDLIRQTMLHADETTVNVVKSDKVKSYMWLYCTGTDSPVLDSSIPNIVLFDYHNSRAGACTVNYLEGFNGYLQVDGYQAYAQTSATLVEGAHARRKFIEAKQAQGKHKSGKADMALSYIQKLYGIEAQFKGKTPEEKFSTRQEKAKPIIDKLHQWLTNSHVLTKSKLGEGITYLNNQWPKLVRYLEDSQLNIDNNRAERAVKPFVIGRKN